MMYANELQGKMLSATHDYYAVMISLQEDYERAIKREASGNPLAVTRLMSACGDECGGVDGGHPTNTAFGPRQQVATAYYPNSLMGKVKKPTSGKIVAPSKESAAASKAALKRLNKTLDVKPPLTHNKLVRLMGVVDVPMEKYAAHRVDILIRKYMTTKLEEFTDKTFRKAFFSTAPPFWPVNKVNMTWERDVKGLLRTAINSEGMLIKHPTDRLLTIIKYCGPIIKGAYQSFDAPIPGQTSAAVFVNRVTTFNGFAGLANNISSNLRYNASSLIFHYFKWASPTTTFANVRNTLADIQTGSNDVEDVLLKNLLVVDEVQENTDKAVTDPYNVVAIGGFPYKQIAPALRAEYVLLKLFFFFCAKYGRADMIKFVNDNYRRKYNQQDVAAFTINNVLQLCPGLMTLMFFMINQARDAVGMKLLEELTHQFRVLVSVKSHVGRQEAVELHKSISGLLEKIAVTCMSLIVTKTIKTDLINDFVNLLFLRSGLIREGSYSASATTNVDLQQ